MELLQATKDLTIKIALQTINPKFLKQYNDIVSSTSSLLSIAYSLQELFDKINHSLYQRQINPAQCKINEFVKASSFFGIKLTNELSYNPTTKANICQHLAVSLWLRSTGVIPKQKVITKILSPISLFRLLERFTLPKFLNEAINIDKKNLSLIANSQVFTNITNIGKSANSSRKRLFKFTNSIAASYCLKCHTDKELTVDHIIAKSINPKLKDSLYNYQCLCKLCNSEKSNKNSNDYRPLWILNELVMNESTEIVKIFSSFRKPDVALLVYVNIIKQERKPKEMGSILTSYNLRSLSSSSICYYKQKILDKLHSTSLCIH